MFVTHLGDISVVVKLSERDEEGIGMTNHLFSKRNDLLLSGQSLLLQLPLHYQSATNNLLVVYFVSCWFPNDLLVAYFVSGLFC